MFSGEVENVAGAGAGAGAGAAVAGVLLMLLMLLLLPARQPQLLRIEVLCSHACALHQFKRSHKSDQRRQSVGLFSPFPVLKRDQITALYFDPDDPFFCYVSVYEINRLSVIKKS